MIRGYKPFSQACLAAGSYGPRATPARRPSRSRVLSSTSPPAAEPPLAGSIASHTSYILLHTRIPPTEYPSKIPSRLQRTLQLNASQWGGIVNFAWTPDQDCVHPDTKDAEWESARETYRLTAFSRFRGRLEVSEIKEGEIEGLLEVLKAHGSPLSPGEDAAGTDVDPVSIYVCTHRNRDCRCGDTGSAFFEALRSEVAGRQLESRVQVGAVGHVGGHKYAANALVFPSGDWLGNLDADMAPQVLDAVLARHNGQWQDHLRVPPLLSSHWRGRMGLNKEMSLALLNGNHNVQLPLKPTNRS
ncbi:Sucrase/ferredoxin-like-domain-containing protein [Cristinia sonorae]|uniref:Sucrase/ferredoxin-like-domain-containing protein n=1 Tax=Cristinia sonorae TaxID=1940300 RepID=A0A8K0XS81_9AGAR|nr:Sucrase/ferredoxin-like-domain-containing protein [Cristinia sonorae]